MGNISQGYGSQLHLCATVTDGALSEVCGVHNRVTCRRQTKQAGSTLLFASYGKLSNFQVVDGLDTDLVCW